MIPENRLSSEPVSGYFLYPNGIVRTALEYYEMGGVAIQDPSKGVRHQPWYGYWRDNKAYLCPNISGTPIEIFEQEDVIQFAFCFDQNMEWQAVTVDTEDVMTFYWFDAGTNSRAVTTYPGVQSAALTLDDKRDLATRTGASDVLLTYIKGQELLMRRQRDRYEDEYILSDTLAGNLLITYFGMTDKMRLEWKLRNRSL